MRALRLLTIQLLVLALLGGCHDWSIDGGDGDGDGDADGDGDCLCSAGECCDGCHFLGPEERCSDEPVSAEYRCASGECGADAERRGVFRHCSGVSAECPEDMLREGVWEPVEECSEGQTCVFAGGVATCHSCSEGCSAGQCNEAQCSAGPCCSGERFAPATTRCGATPEAEECRCSSGQCGADVQCRAQLRYCTGSSAECTAEHLEWEDFALATNCGADDVCLQSGGAAECEACPHGCESGACIDEPPTCGDDSCNGDETAVTCPEDCDPSCGDGDCTHDETHDSCPGDCDLVLDWTERPGLSPEPTDRRDHGMVYDSGREVMVLFGGAAVDDSTSDEVWEFDGILWSNPDPTERPPGRSAHAMVYDSRRGVVVVHGGRDFYRDRRDTWEWDGTTWTEASTSGPAVADHAMAFDSRRNVTVLFGGNGFVDDLDSTYEWDGSSWEVVTPTSSPDGRHDHAMAYDSRRNVTVLFSGARSGTSHTTFGDTWEYDGTSWTRVSSGGPDPRTGGTMACDSTRGVCMVFGGWGYTTYVSGTWEWDGSSWSELVTATTPPAHGDAASAYDAAREVIVMWGGCAMGDDELWELGYVTP